MLRSKPAAPSQLYNSGENVLLLQGATLDRAYLEEWARELGFADLLHRALEDAGWP